MTAYVYRAFNAAGRLLYVGCTTQPGQRMVAHRRESVWWSGAVRFTFAAFADHQQALAAESDAITAELPRYNVAGRSPFHPEGPFRMHHHIAQAFPQDCAAWLARYAANVARREERAA